MVHHRLGQFFDVVHQQQFHVFGDVIGRLHFHDMFHTFAFVFGTFQCVHGQFRRRHFARMVPWHPLVTFQDQQVLGTQFLLVVFGTARSLALANDALTGQTAVDDRGRASTSFCRFVVVRTDVHVFFLLTIIVFFFSLRTLLVVFFD